MMIVLEVFFLLLMLGCLISTAGKHNEEWGMSAICQIVGISVLYLTSCNEESVAVIKALYGIYVVYVLLTSWCALAFSSAFARNYTIVINVLIILPLAATIAGFHRHGLWNPWPFVLFLAIFIMAIFLTAIKDSAGSSGVMSDKMRECDSRMNGPATVGDLFYRPGDDSRCISAGGHYYIPKDVQLWKKGTCRYDAEELSQMRAMHGDFTPGFYDDWKWMITLGGRDVTYEGIDKSLLKAGAKIYCHESLVETFKECGFRAIAH